MAKDRFYCHPDILEKLKAIKGRVERPYARKGEKRHISINDVLVWLLGKLELMDYNGDNSKQIQTMKEKMYVMVDEIAKKKATERKLIKKYVEKLKFNGGQHITLDYSKVPGLDQFVIDEDMEIIRQVKAKK